MSALFNYFLLVFFVLSIRKKEISFLYLLWSDEATSLAFLKVLKHFVPDHILIDDVNLWVISKLLVLFCPMFSYFMLILLGLWKLRVIDLILLVSAISFISHFTYVFFFD